MDLCDSVGVCLGAARATLTDAHSRGVPERLSGLSGTFRKGRPRNLDPPFLLGLLRLSDLSGSFRSFWQDSGYAIGMSAIRGIAMLEPRVVRLIFGDYLPRVVQRRAIGISPLCITDASTTS
jgi:hypothetical protein